MRGRYPSGPEFVDKLDGSLEAKQRLQVLLQTVTGQLRVVDACAQLSLKESRFDELRLTLLQAALEAAERGRPGRRATPATPQDSELRQLRERIAELEAQLRVALVRVEIAAALPRVGSSVQKKTPASKHNRARRSKPPS